MKVPAIFFKSTLIAVLVAFVFTLFTPLTLAAEYAPIPQTSNPTYYNYNESVTEPDVPKNAHTDAQVFLIEAMNAIVCQLIGRDMMNPGKACLGVNMSTGKIGYAKDADPQKIGGVMGTVTTLIGSTYNIPIHLNDYTTYMASNFGISKKAYAEGVQGVGFKSLSPLLGIWTRIRDICYLGFVIILIIVGFGIMLRLKIDPRTVMAVQNQIPRIIVAILLITFSYAIAGFLIDAMWTVTYIGINVITAESPCGAAGKPEELTATATNNLLTDPLHYVGALFSDSAGCATGGWGFANLALQVGVTIGDIITSLLSQAILGTNSAGGTCISILPPDFNLGNCIYGLFKYVIGFIAFLIIAVAILAQLFRVWFALLKSYVTVLMYTLLGPFYIFLGLVPGVQSFGFGTWIRYMAAGLSVFPVTAFIFVVAVVIANNPQLNDATADHFVPPLIGNPNVTNNLGMIVGLGAILIAPEVVNMMRSAFKAQPSKYIPQIFAGATAGAAMAGAPAGAIWSRLNARDNSGRATGILSYRRDAIIAGLGKQIRPIGALIKRSPQYTDFMKPSEPKKDSEPKKES